MKGMDGVLIIYVLYMFFNDIYKCICNFWGIFKILDICMLIMLFNFAFERLLFYDDF